MPARYETIAGWANEFGWTRGVELGVFDGRTHLYLQAKCPQLHLIGIDVWDTPGFKEGPTKSGEQCFCPYCSETRKSRKARSITQMRLDVFASRDKERSWLMVGETARLTGFTQDESLDFVFIDADHSTEGVSADIAAWRGKVKPGGRVIGHDWNMEAVRNGALQHFAEADIQTGDDHLWWVQV